MIKDSGIVEVYTVRNDGQNGNMPILVPDQLVTREFFEDRLVSYQRFYQARGVDEQIDLLIRIWQNRSVRIGMVRIIENEQYVIDNVQHLFDDDNLRVTDLTLRRITDGFAR